MSAAPLNFQPLPVSCNTILPYHHQQFWMNLTPQGQSVGVNMNSKYGRFVASVPHSNDARIVYGTPAPLSCRDPVPYEYQLLGVGNAKHSDERASEANQESPPTVGPLIDLMEEKTNMPVPIHHVPTLRKKHYHQRHHGHAMNMQAENLKNKPRFSATGLTSNYIIVRDTKMSLSSAPSSPGAGSRGGSLGHCYAFMQPQARISNSAFHIPQCKGYSSLSSCSSSVTSLKISSSSMSSNSSMSSTPSLSGISPRKRRAEDDPTDSIYGKETSCRKFYQRLIDGSIIVHRCSCEFCRTDEVTARVCNVTLGDEPVRQQEKRMKQDLLIPATVSQRASSHNKGRPIRKAKKSLKKEQRSKKRCSSNSVQEFPFVVPDASPPISSGGKDVGGRYFLRSSAKSRKPDEGLAVYGEQVGTPTVVQSISTNIPQNRMQIDVNNNSVDNGESKIKCKPRYHTRSRQKKADCEQQVLKAKPMQDAKLESTVQVKPDTTQSPSIQAANSPQPATVIQTPHSGVSQKAPALKSLPVKSQRYIPFPNDASDSVKDALRPSSSLKKCYDIHGMIGIGGGGAVHAGTRKSDGLQVAIKQVPKTKVKRWGKLNGATVPIEFELLYKASRSGHPGVIRMIGWYERRNSYVLVMERPQPVIDLFDYLNQSGPLPEQTARSIFYQIGTAVLHCHANGVVHRDIKDENVLLNLHTTEAKLIDFGCGTVLKDKPFTEFAGTPEFYPPEWFTHRRYYGERVDAWSLGVLLYTMVEAEVPFQKEKDIVECNLRHKRGAELSQPCKDLIAWMLQKDQTMRPTIKEVLEHEWIRGTNTSYIPLNRIPANVPKCESNAKDSSVADITYSDHIIASQDSPESPDRVIGYARPEKASSSPYHRPIHHLQASCHTVNVHDGGTVVF